MDRTTHLILRIIGVFLALAGLNSLRTINSQVNPTISLIVGIIFIIIGCILFFYPFKVQPNAKERYNDMQRELKGKKHIIYPKTFWVGIIILIIGIILIAIISLIHYIFVAYIGMIMIIAGLIIALIGIKRKFVKD